MLSYFIEGVMLTMIFLMRALDPEKYIGDTYDLLTRLMDCDGMRKEYYKDLSMNHNNFIYNVI